MPHITDEKLRATHEANKREMFDGMRAYHQSEISHKQDAISMLTTLLTAVGAIFAAIILPERAIPHAMVLSFSTAIVTGALAAVIVVTSNRKIAKDHELYASFGAEYVRASEVLGLYESVSGLEGVTSVKVRTEIGKGKGYQHTQHIVAAVGISVGTLALLAAIYVSLTQ